MMALIIEASRSGQNFMKHVPCVSIILENTEGDVLLLRDNKSTIVFPNRWTLVDGKVEDGETPFIVDQYVYVGKVEASREPLVPGECRDIQFFKRCEITHLKIGYGFKALLNEYFLTTIGNVHVHHA
jgi:8-oxo-dGTP pyrophosphatase MutT (NUDIX family)